MQTTRYRSHLVTVPPGPLLSEALMSSPVVVGEDGSGAPPANMAGFEFGIDPNEDPELALVRFCTFLEKRDEIFLQRVCRRVERRQIYRCALLGCSREMFVAGFARFDGGTKSPSGG